MTLGDMRLIAQPGRGVASRRGACILFVADASEPALEDLLRIAQAGGEAAGVIDDLFDVVRQHRPTEVSAFCVVLEDEGQLRVAIHGALELSGEDAEGSIHLAGRDAKSRVEDSLGEAVQELSVAARSPKASQDPFLDLVEGVV